MPTLRSALHQDDQLGADQMQVLASLLNYLISCTLSPKNYDAFQVLHPLKPWDVCGAFPKNQLLAGFVFPRCGL